MKKHTKYLTKIGACKEAIAYFDQWPDAQTAWENSERGEWMLWYLGKQAGPVGSASRLKLVFVAAQCAKLALKYTKDKRVAYCIDVVEKYTRKMATLDDVRAVRKHVDAAAAAAAAAVAAYAAAVAAYAAGDAYANDAAGAAAAGAAAATAVANDAAGAAAAAAVANDAAGAAAATAYATFAAASYAADAAATREQTSKECADIVRKYYPTVRLGRWVPKRGE